jgi:thiamine biosynthesis lipoprotein
MWFILTRAEKAFFESDGGFDITVKPLMDLWGFYRKRRQIPTAEEITAVKAKVGFDKLKLDHNRRTVQFTVKGMALDLGGIAKGYALDRAAQAVVASGIDCGIIDLGGNLKLLQRTPPGKDFYTIGIKNPAQPDELLAQTIKLSGNQAVSTSGAYERFVIIENRRYGHIISPKTGSPTTASAVSVIAGTAVDADIYSTSCSLGGEAVAAGIKQEKPETEIIFTR